MHQKVQELESGAQQKAKQLELEYEYKQKIAEQDRLIAADKYEREMAQKVQESIDAHKLEIAKAQQAGELALEKARIDADAKVDAALIEAETKLVIAGMEVPPELHAEMPEGEELEEQPDPVAERHTQLIEAVHKLAESVAKPRKRTGRKLKDGSIEITEI